MKLVSLSVLLFPVFVSASEKHLDIVYGDDNRAEISERPLWFHHAQAVGAMVSKYELNVASERGIVVSPMSLGLRMGLCEGERFRNQPSIANCSGFLVAPDVLMTAGHCITSQADCDTYRWVFDYQMSNSNENPSFIDPKNVYECKSIIAQSGGLLKNDYAIIKLNRASDRQPLKLLPEGKSAQKGDALVMLGFPSGLPMKVTDGGKVVEKNMRSLLTNLDAFGGNSGSVVLDEKSGLVVGILVSGKTDYVNQGGCVTVNRVDESKGKEKVTSIKVVPRNF